jgi:1-deoxy-D-xylulose-5-phosphate synthase
VVKPAGSAGLVLVESAALLHPGETLFEAMLDGWRRQHAARRLSPTITFKRQRTVRRFATFTGAWPWQWRAEHLDDWVAQGRWAHSTIRSYQGSIAVFMDYLCDPRYGWAKNEIAGMMEKLPQGELLLELGKRWKDSFKEFVYHAMIWEELGFTYMGPVAGHDIKGVVEALRQARKVAGPVFLHVVTEKGKGFAAAESDAERGHAVSAKAAPRPEGTPAPPPRYQDVFAQTLIELAKEDPRIVAITAAMPTGTSLSKFAKCYPDRFFDVGIAEQHGVTFAAGLATQGLQPVCAIYSTFLQRAYDQIVHDVCLQKLPVVFALDRAGFAGDDGRTHHGIYDLTYLRCLPGMTIMAPKDENELRHMLKTALALGGPVAVRYPRGSGVGVAMDDPLHALPIGRAETLRDGDDVAILAVGSMVLPAERAADLLAHRGVRATVVNARFVKPLDERLILDLAARCGAFVTVEENSNRGGFGAAVLELLAEYGVVIPVRTLAVPDRIFEQASQARLREMAGLTPDGIAAAAVEARRRGGKLARRDDLIGVAPRVQ